MLWGLVSLTLLLWAATAARTWRALAATPRLAGTPAPRSPTVAVFVPVRDEAHNLGRLRQGLRAQRGVDLRIVIYDDRSSDGSGPQLDGWADEDPKLQVIHGREEPPEGCFGKPHALSQAVQAAPAGADLWLFLDADVELAPDALAAMARELEETGADVLSVIPALALETFWAGVLGPNFAAVATMPYPPARVNDPRDPTAFFNGQAVLMRRQAYLASGGFAAVQGEVLEDVALARRLKQGGAALRLVDGQALLRVHMYRGLAEHVRGWGKNIFELLGRSRARAVALAAFVVAMAYLPVACLALGLTALASGRPGPGALALLGYAFPTAVQIAIRARARAAPLLAPLAPLGASVVAATLLHAAFWRRAVVWKGRRYPR